eukprot:gene8049-819_t
MGGKAGANRQAIAMNDTYITDEAAEGTLAGAQSEQQQSPQTRHNEKKQQPQQQRQTKKKDPANKDVIKTCQRGQASGGRSCKKKPLPNSAFCKGHSCPHDGCSHSKSNKDAACPTHLPPGTRARAPTADVTSPTTTLGTIARGGHAKASGVYGFEEDEDV